MSEEQLIRNKITESLLHLKMVARNSGMENFKEYGLPADIISELGRKMLRRQIKANSKAVKRKYNRKAIGSAPSKKEDNSAAKSKSSKSAANSKSSARENHDHENTDSDHADNYCMDCHMPISTPKEPWKSLQPCKLAEEVGHGKHIGQAQYQMESYLNCVNAIYNNRSMIPHGLHNSQVYLFNRAKVLGCLSSDLAPSTPLENWSPREIAIFEAAISVYGKEFYNISKCVKSKTTQEVIEFYYTWKFSSHYYTWKKHFCNSRR